jgi:hypothetical protein
MPPAQKKVRYIAIEDLATDLGVLERDLRAMVKDLSPPLGADHRGREAVPETCIPDLISREDYLRAVQSALLGEREARNQTREDDAAFRRYRAALLASYRPLIAELERVHAKYLPSANQAGFESSGMAVYLLLSRVISTLKMHCDCLGLGHWYSGSLLRDVDECLDLAHYFAISKGTATGEAARQRWFRQNISPSHATCREAISAWQASLFGPEADDHLELMKELYRKKSKWVHPTYISVREITRFDITDGVRIASMDYGPCGYEQKLLELTEFFRSSIWSAFQCLCICFQLTLSLTEEDAALLRDFDRKFQEWTDGA